MSIFSLLLLSFLSFLNADVCPPDYTTTIVSPEQRPKELSSKTPTYEAKRTPSYCDRIMLGWTKSQSDSTQYFQLFQYNAITDPYIDLSDHDLVYGYFSFSDMNILSVSFNLGDLIKSTQNPQTIWNTIICSIKTALQNNKQEHHPAWDSIDIFFFGFQEANAQFDDTFLSLALYSSMTDSQREREKDTKWRTVTQEFGPGDFGLSTPRNTFSYILYNAETVFHSAHLTVHDVGCWPSCKKALDKIKAHFHSATSNSMTLKWTLKQGDGEEKTWRKRNANRVKEMMGTKTVVINGKFRKLSHVEGDGTRDKSYNIKARFVVFGNTHLPIDTKNKKDWGVKWRNEAMDQIQRKFMNVYVKDEQNDLLVLVGDLNYRVLNPNEDNEKEQLEMYLESKKEEGFWYELDVKQDGNKRRPPFLPTCKRKEGTWSEWKRLQSGELRDIEKKGKQKEKSWKRIIKKAKIFSK